MEILEKKILEAVRKVKKDWIKNAIENCNRTKEEAEELFEREINLFLNNASLLKDKNYDGKTFLIEELIEDMLDLRSCSEKEYCPQADKFDDDYHSNEI